MLQVRKLKVAGAPTLDLDLAAGECLAMSGASGSGKSRLLRAIADLLPSRGSVSWRGVDRWSVPAPQWRRRVGYLAAEPGWWADGIAAHFADWRTAEPMLGALGLPGDCGAWPVARASTGERQRLALVRLLCGGPEVLLLDEPTAALDEAATARVERLVAQRRAAGAAVVWVTHDAVQARRVADRHLALRDGAAVEAGR